MGGLKYDDITRQMTIEDDLKVAHCRELKLKAQEFEKPDLIQVDYHDDRFIFRVETTGALKPHECVMMALAKLKEKMTLISTNLNYEGEDSGYQEGIAS